MSTHHKHFFSPLKVRLVPFAARSGYTVEDLQNTPGLRDELKDQYTRSHGHDPKGSWIPIVHSDGRSDSYPFDNPDEMWCCTRANEILAELDREVLARKGQCPRTA